MRLVRTPDGAVVVDPTGRLAGRGAYVCRMADCLDKAIAKGALSRALRTPLPAGVRASLAGSITDHTVEGGARGQE
ncbi:MAG: uncharacterized protein QOJ75_352 [Chloroflexota bacterium]|jgi:predicted RNA-binding protein YlxR (DUF448 family)|nr:uncharacterized protein [Chloroflexota bacterium]